MNCSCGKISENRETGLCAGCSRAERKAETDALKIKKKHKPIAKQSDKMKEDNKTYLVLRKVFLESKGMCEAGLLCCSGKATTVHHKKGRGNNLLNVKTWLAVCMECHTFIELNPDFAKENGFSESRLSKK